jgi:hypothetical protein
MTRNNKKINWRHILLHFVGIWCLQTLGMHIGYLSEAAYLESLKTMVLDDAPQGWLVSKYLHIMLKVGYISAGMLVAGFLLSLGLSIYRKWFWVNSLLSFVFLILISILIGYTHHPLGWLFNPVNTFPGSVLIQQLFFVGFFILLAIFIFFLPVVNRWIEKPYRESIRQQELQLEEENLS